MRLEVYHLLFVFLDPFNEATTHFFNLSCRDLEAEACVDEADEVDKVIIIFVMEEAATEDDGCDVLSPK